MMTVPATHVTMEAVKMVLIAMIASAVPDIQVRPDIAVAPRACVLIYAKQSTTDFLSFF